MDNCFFKYINLIYFNLKSIVIKWEFILFYLKNFILVLEWDRILILIKYLCKIYMYFFNVEIWYLLWKKIIDFKFKSCDVLY